MEFITVILDELGHIIFWCEELQGEEQIECILNSHPKWSRLVMNIGDKVRVTLPWKFGYNPVEETGFIEEIYSNGICKVKVLLEYGGYRTAIGCIKDCIPIK